jgi:hypothetical protein
MKRFIYFGILMIFMMSSPAAIAGKADMKSATEYSAVKAKTENKLSEKEISLLTKRVEEIRNMDRSKMTTMERRELRKELKGMKEKVRKDGSVIIISGSTLLLIIVLIILL